MKVMRAIKLQFSPRIRTVTADASTIIRNIILCLCTEVPAEDFLNFIENIGISLTRRTLRISETAGMNQDAEAHPVNMLSGSRVT